MSEWWAYRPEDFLLFSPRVYWRMFELHNAAWWPLHLATLAGGLAILVRLLRPSYSRALWIGVGLAALWAFVGWSFFWHRYAGINWVAAYLAPAFWLQALLLAAAGPAAVRTYDRRDLAGCLGLLLAAIGIIAYPLLPALFGRPWTSAEIFGIAPDPTAIVTLGLLLTSAGRLAPWLLPIPLLWLLVSGLTLHTMGDTQAWVPLSAVGAAVLQLILRRFTK